MKRKAKRKANAENAEGTEFAEKRNASGERGIGAFDRKPAKPTLEAGTLVDAGSGKREAQLLCAGAGWAGGVMPPAYGLGEVVKMVVVTASIVFLPGLLVSVKPGPSAFVGGGGVLRFVPGESSDRRRSEQDASTGEY